MCDTGRGGARDSLTDLGDAAIGFHSGRGGQNSKHRLLGRGRGGFNRSHRGSVRSGNGRASFQEGPSRRYIVARAFLTSYTTPSRDRPPCSKNLS
jgi:hypothetical protein